MSQYNISESDNHSRKFSEANYMFQSQRNDDSRENPSFRHSQLDLSNQLYPPVLPLLNTSTSATTLTPNTTTGTSSEGGQPGSLIDDGRQPYQSSTGPLLDYRLHIDLYPTGFGTSVTQTPLLNVPSGVSAQGYPIQPAGGQVTDNGEEDGVWEDLSAHNGFGDGHDVRPYHDTGGFPPSSGALLTAVNNQIDVTYLDTSLIGPYFSAVPSDPWNQLRIPQDQSPLADQAMFDPAHDYDTGSSHVHNIYRDIPTPAEVNVDINNAILSSEQMLPKDSVNNPSRGNLVGPPKSTVGNPKYKIKKASKTIRKGRRRKGLSPQGRMQAGKMRNIKACWHCKVMRYTCDEDEPCAKCKAMRHSSFPWGCIRYRLPELTNIFLPGSLLNQHQETIIREFARKYIRRWTRNSIVVILTWGYSITLEVEAQEFETEGDHLRFHNQFKWDPATKQYARVRTPSPPLGIVLTLYEDCAQKLERPLGMVLMSINDWRQRLREYLDKVFGNFGDFPDHCFRGSGDELNKDLLHSFYKYYKSMAESKGQALLEVFLKLIIINKIMMHTLTLTENSKQYVIERLRYCPPETYGTHTSARCLNKQLKFLFSALHKEFLNNALEEVHKILGASRRSEQWGLAVVGLLTLTMTIEFIEMIIRCKEATDRSENVISESNNDAALDIKHIEEKYACLQGLYHQAFLKNPILQDKDRERLDVPSQDLARDLENIIRKHRQYPRTLIEAS